MELEQESLISTLFHRVFNTKGVASSSTHITLATTHVAIIVPILKLLLALSISYMISGLLVGGSSGGGSKKPRLSCAVVSATLCAFMTYAFLEPLMIHSTSTSGSGREMELNHVALVILSSYAAAIGAALGSLLPRPLGGVTLGCGVSVGLVTLLPRKLIGGNLLGEFVVWGPVLCLVGGVLSTR
jgi:hypothetical protein